MGTLPLSNRGLRPCLQIFVCKGLLALFHAIRLQRTIALVFCYWFANSCCPFLPLYVCKGLRILISCYSFTKDCGPCFLFHLKRTAVLTSASVYKGSWSLSSAIHLQRMFSAIRSQRIAVLVYLFQLQRTAAVLVSPSVYKRLQPCLVLFVCKGPWSLSCAVHLQRTAVLVMCYSFAKD